MFVRCQKLKGDFRRAVMICQSTRIGSKVSQKTIRYFGVAHTEKELKSLQKIARLELRKLKSSSTPTQPPVKWENLKEEKRIIDGMHDIFGTMFDRLNLSPFFSRLRYKQLRDVTIARIATPSSKCYTAKLLSQQYGRPLSEDQIYRLMDRVAPHIGSIKSKIFEFTRLLSPQEKIDLLFFDVTTLYFESQKADNLRDFGYSKDHKIGETQVVLALATTSEGLPIGYELFSGKTAEVKTLLRSLHEWREIADIGDVIVIADRAMMSNDNLLEMERHRIRYVVAAKLKQYPKNLKERILNCHEESTVQVRKEEHAVQEHSVAGRRLIVSYSKSRALKDQGDRERLLDRLQKKVGKGTNPKKLVTNRGYLKFLNDQEEGEVVINEEKIAQDCRWDGLHGIITNDFTSSAEELLNRYRQLWVIEESFRINKHTLAMRPIFHFKAERIQTHILICYIAFALSRYVQYQIKEFGLSMSVDLIRTSLLQVESSILKSGEEKYRVPSKMDKDAEQIYRAMGIARSLRTIRLDERKCSVTQKMQATAN